MITQIRLSVFLGAAFLLAPMVHSQNFAPVFSDGKWGLSDASGNAVIPPRYAQIRPFQRGFAQVAMKDSAGTLLWGLVGSSGSEVMPPKYSGIVVDSSWIRFSVPGHDEAGAYQDFWGVVDHQGQILVQPMYRYIGELKDGRAAFRRDSLWGFLSSTGAEAVTPAYRYRSEFRSGRSRVTTDGQHYGFIDTMGTVVVPLEMDGVTDFSEGYAVVQREDTRDVIDVTGKIILPCLVRCKVYEVRGAKGAGLVVANLEDKLGIADRKGRVLLSPKYEGLTPTDTGSVWSYQDKGVWGYIDARTGKPLMKAQWKEVGEFRDGLGPVKADSVANFWAYVDRKGKMVTPVQFLKANSFSEGFASAVMPNPATNLREWVLIDRGGKIVTYTGLAWPKYTVTSFIDGCAKVLTSGDDGFGLSEVGCLDHQGRRWFSAP